MEAGRLHDLVSLQENTPTRDAGGAPVDVWTDLLTAPAIWADVEPLSGREFLEAARVNAEITHRIRVRYRSDLTERMRIVLGTRIFDILAVLEMDRRRELHLMCREFKG